MENQSKEKELQLLRAQRGETRRREGKGQTFNLISSNVPLFEYFHVFRLWKRRLIVWHLNVLVSSTLKRKTCFRDSPDISLRKHWQEWGHLQPALSRLPTAAWWQDGQSTNTPHLKHKHFVNQKSTKISSSFTIFWKPIYLSKDTRKDHKHRYTVEVGSDWNRPMSNTSFINL